MEITFVNPGADYMIQRMMDFQAEEESAFWSEPLYLSLIHISEPTRPY